MTPEEWPRERKWRHLYLKDVKVRAGQELGFEGVPLDSRELAETEALNVLFICTMNRWRSPTAEKLYARHPLLECRSAGVSSKARRRLKVADLRWADLVVVMEDKHLDRMEAQFRDELRFKETHVLGVEDRYRFMDPELLAELTSALDPLLRVER